MSETFEPTVEIQVRLLQNGKYIWTITANDTRDKREGVIAVLKQLDGSMRDTFPDHVTKVTTGVSTIPMED